MLLLCHQICELWRCCALLGLHTCLSLCALASLQTWCWDAFLLKVCAYIDLFVWLLDVLFVKDWYLHLFLSSLGVFLFFAHSPLAIKPRSLPWVTDLVLSRTFLSLKSSRCTILSAVNVRIIIACCFFWGFTWLFGTGTLLWAVICEKVASLFDRSEA